MLATVPAIPAPVGPPHRFDPASHTYTVGDRRLPSVTEILHRVGLIDDRWYTEFGRARGSAVHDTLELLDMEGSLTDYAVDPRLQPYVEAYERFCVDHPIVWDAVEYRYFNVGRGYAGTVDRLGRDGDRRVVLDFKTGQPEPFHAIQLAGYARLVADDEPGVRETRIQRVGLYLRSDGQYRMQVYDDRKDFSVFEAALLVTQWMLCHER